MPEAKLIELSSGVRVCVETIDSVRSVGISWAVPAGTTSEPEKLSGLVSIGEEMLMRGAGSRDSRALADAFDRVGMSRSIDAGDRYMRFGGVCLADRLGDALELVADNVFHPTLRDEDVGPARELARGSLASLQDEPRERAALAARERHYPSPYNRSPHGTEAGIDATTGEDVRAWWSERCKPGGSIIGLAGAVDEGVVEVLERLTKDVSGEAMIPTPEGPSPRGYGHLTDDANQVQILLLAEAPPAEDEAVSLRERLVTHVLSGGMSSRLFTEVREKRGLCYTVSASYRASRGLGVLHAYVGTTPERAQQSLDVLTEELLRVTTPGGAITEEEFGRAIAGMKASVVFHGESTSARAGALVSDCDRLGRLRSLDEIASAIDALTLDEVNEHAKTMTLDRPTVQTLGPEPLNVPEALGLGS